MLLCQKIPRTKLGASFLAKKPQVRTKMLRKWQISQFNGTRILFTILKKSILMNRAWRKKSSGNFPRPETKIETMALKSNHRATISSSSFNSKTIKSIENKLRYLSLERKIYRFNLREARPKRIKINTTPHTCKPYSKTKSVIKPIRSKSVILAFNQTTRQKNYSKMRQIDIF